MTPEKLETIFPMTLATSLIDGDEHANSSVQALCKPIAFSQVSWMVIVIKFITNPRVVRTCVGMKMDFSECTTKPKLSNNTVMWCLQHFGHIPHKLIALADKGHRDVPQQCALACAKYVR